MAHTYVSCPLHIVFSTRNRTPTIAHSWRPQLHAMIAAIAKKRECPTLIVGGVQDHVHLLLSLSPNRTISECLRIIKGTSSKWINDEYFPDRSFAWQEGFGAFAVGASLIDKTVDYIKNQEEHHRIQSFQDEYYTFLYKNGIEWDAQYSLG